MKTARPVAPMDDFSHEAFLYEDIGHFVSSMAAFLREGVAAGEPALVVVDPDKITLLRAALGDDAEAVGFVDMRRVGGNPARIIPVWEDFVTRSGLQRPLRGIGEPVWPGRSDDELPECHQHEALLNLAFGHVPMRLVCPYNTRDLPRTAVDEALHTHPYSLNGEGVVTSGAYRPVASDLALDGPALPEPSAPVAVTAVGRNDLAEMRRAVHERAQDAGLWPGRANDLAFAANELATNSILHGSGKAELRWWSAGPSLIVEVHDGGVITEPLVGRRFPSTAVSDGRGLWLVNQLCDLVQIRSSRAGTTVRVHMLIEGPAQAD